MTATLRFRTVWLSDIHLGYHHCKADFLLEFLAHMRCDTLYLVGDVIDLWSLRTQFHWPREHSAVLRNLHARAAEGSRVVYVPGNHDELLRDLAGISFGGIPCETRVEHITADGRRLLVTHGDEFEAFIRCGALTRLLGDASYTLLLRINRIYNRLRLRGGKPYWSLATYLKNRIGNARKAIDCFERAAIEHARAHGFDGVVCGHIHQPRLREEEGVSYCNDGDWVENCTALVERQDGRLELLHWGELRESLSAPATAWPAPVPITALAQRRAGKA